MKIVTSKAELSKRVEVKQLSQKQIDDVSEILKVELERNGGIGLSANQIGIDIRACIINVIDPLVLINPVVKSVSQETVAYIEQCLSIPKSMKDPCKTIRFEKITVNTDNLGVIEFGPNYVEAEGGRRWKTSDEFFGDRGLLECVCVQHEIDHLDGLLMTHSRRRYSATLVAPKKYGRNEKVMVKLPDGSTEFMKYKRALPMLEYGCEIL